MFRKISLAVLVLVALNAAPASAEERGTFIHVKNGTNKTLKFDLYVNCAGAGLGKFDNMKEVGPGQVVVWHLPAGRSVATQVKDGQTYYGVGLVGADESGKSVAWGLVGGSGMIAKEKAGQNSKHILVQPIGQL